jgi:hypothetical protein
MAAVKEPPAPDVRSEQVVGRRLLSALAAATTFVSLTVVTGFCVAALRVSTIGMSPEDVVTKLGTDHLLEVGAYQLAVFAIAGLLAVALCWLIARHGTTLGHKVTGTWLAVGGLIVAVMTFDAAPTARIVAILMLVAGGACLTVVALTRGSDRVLRWVHRHGWFVLAAGLAIDAVVFAVLWDAHETIAATVYAVFALLAGVLMVLAVASCEEPQSTFLRVLVRIANGVRKGLTVALFLLVAGCLAALTQTWALPALAALAFGLAVWLRNAPDGKKRSFRRHAVRVFASVLVFGATLIVLNAVVEPGAQPVAVLGPNGIESVGIYVGSTGGSVLVALGPHCRRDKNLVLQPDRLKRETASLQAFAEGAVAIGGNTPLRQVFEKAGEELNSLRARAGLPPYPPAAQCQDEGPVDLTVRASIPVAPPRAAELAALYRPILRFDSDERWRPLNIERLFGERLDGQPIHAICTTNGGCTPIRDANDLATAKPAFVDLSGVALGGRDYTRPDLAACPPQSAELRDCDDGPASAIYYSAQRANHRTYIDYWWFLRYNHFARYGAQELCSNSSLRAVGSLSCLEHEGDWEGVTAVTAVGDESRLEYVDFAAHEGVYRRSLGQLEMVGQRPRVYVAEGSHAAYRAACPRRCPQVAQIALGLHVPEDNTNGLAGWARNSDASCNASPRCLLPLPAAGWSTFAGLWGSQTCVVGSASCRLAVPPRSPSQQRRSQSPWCYTDEEKGGLRCDPGDIDRRPPG